MCTICMELRSFKKKSCIKSSVLILFHETYIYTVLPQSCLLLFKFCYEVVCLCFDLSVLIFTELLV